MESIWVGIDPRFETTRVLALAGPARPTLKATLLPQPASRLALPTLLEALALWQGHPVRGALVVDTTGPSCRVRSAPDAFGPPRGTHYELVCVDALRPVRRDGLGGMGGFNDLHQLLLAEAAR